MQTRGKIVLTGVLDQFGSTNIYMAKAFMKAGFEVAPVNYRTILAEHGHNTLKKLIWKLADDKPKLMLFSKCNGIPSIVLGKCGQDDVKTWFWFMDGMTTLSMIPEMIGHAQLCTYTSCTGQGVSNHMKRALGGDKDVYHIMEGIDPEVYRPTILNDTLQADISFIGTNNQERHHYLNLLSTNGFNVAAYGEGFNTEVHGGQFNQVCSSSDSMLALSVEHATDSYFSDRVFRYGACGSFVFHKYSPRMEKYFTHGQDIVFWHDDESLLAMAKEFLGPENEEKRNVISLNLYHKVLQKHTWDNVVGQICTIAGI